MAHDWLWLALMLVGHLGAFVVVVNVVHALGSSDELMNLFKVGSLGFFFIVSLGFVYGTTQSHWTSWPILLRIYAAICLLIALVGVPITSVIRLTRRNPANLVERSEDHNFAESHGRDSLVGDGRHSWILRLPRNESFRLRKREWELVLPNLPQEWDGLSILQLTDLHFAPCYQRLYFELVCEEARRWGSDLVLFTGDLVDHHEAIDWVVPLLSGVKGRLGSYSILGNHDYEQDHELVQQQLEEAGFTDLEARWGTLEIQGKTLAIGGTSYPWGPKLDLHDAPDADFRLLLSHSPDLFYRAAAAGIDLMLSGHNHGGQIRLPFVGPLFMPSVYSRHFDRGFFQSGQTTLHVSQGVGSKHPVRYGCVPEVGRFILRAQEGRSRLVMSLPQVRQHESTDPVLHS